MRTDARSDLLRRVDDDSPWYDKALFHAITALEDIAEEGDAVALRGLRGIDDVLGEFPAVPS